MPRSWPCRLGRALGMGSPTRGGPATRGPARNFDMRIYTGRGFAFIQCHQRAKSLGTQLPYGSHRPRVLILLTILDAAFQFGSHPAYSSVGNNTRGPMAQSSIPDQGPILNCVRCYQVELIIVNPLKWLQRVGGMYPNPIICIQGH